MVINNIKSKITGYLRFLISSELKTQSENTDLVETMNRIACSTSAEYALANMSNATIYDNGASLREGVIKEYLDNNQGNVLEFGVFEGKSLNHISSLLPGAKIYGFDTFSGLPEAWRHGYKEGTFSVDHLPSVRNNTKLVAGLFSESIPQILDEIKRRPIAFIHIDCDLYSSTASVFTLLKDIIIRDKPILVFDEYFNYPYWEQHEFRALKEFISDSGLKKNYIAFARNSQQVAVQLL